MDTGRFIVYMETEDIYSDIAKYVKTRFDTSNYELERPLPKGKNKKAMVLVKNEWQSSECIAIQKMIGISGT